MVTVKLPPSIRSNRIVGEFGDTMIAFYRAPEKGHGIYEAVVGVPYAHPPGETDITIRVGEGRSEKSVDVPLTITEAKYESEQLTVAPKYTKPSAKDLKRINRERAEIAKVYARVTPYKYWKGAFVLPVDSIITSPYGKTRVFNGQKQSPHLGTDLRAPTGTPIRSPAPGIVVMSKDLFYTGNTVMLDHGYGVITFYAHMSKLKVKKGQRVKTGQLLGLSGETGRAQGAHLHWGAVVHKVRINPMELTKVLR